MEWDDEFYWKEDSYYGSVLSIEQARNVIDDFEYSTCTSFSETRSTKQFGQFCLEGSHCIRFSDDTKVKHGSPIPTNGEAFIITGLRLLECHQGPDHRKTLRASAEASFAEKHLSGLPCIFEQRDLCEKRKEVAATLLLYEVNVKECCPACGMKPEEGEELMRCGMCDLRFHRKPHCVGDDFARSDLDVIICKRCNNNVE